MTGNSHDANDGDDVSDRPSPDEELLPEFWRAPEGLTEPALAQLRSFFGNEFVAVWLTSAKRRGLIGDHDGSDGANCRVAITDAGRRRYEDMFPASIEVGLPRQVRRRFFKR